ncbi:g11377 [Coccomyxa elongata]
MAFGQLLLKKQDDLLSRTCLDPSPTSVTSPSGSLGAHHDPAQVEECVQRHMASLAGELQKILQHVTDELATEVNREQQHLILMQDQVDKLSTMLLRELLDISKKAEQEKTQRSCVHRATREALDQLAARVDSQSRQLEQQTCQLDTLQRRLADLEAPLIVRIFRGIWRMFFGRGSGAKTSAAAAADKKGSGAKSGMAKLGTPEEGTLAEERAAFMTPGQRRASREADAE